jgi:Uma2 family endonuclease
MPVTAETFRRVALEDGDAQWELVCGRLVRRPPMTMPHNTLAFELAFALRQQLHPAQYRVRSQSGHLRTDAGYRVPDVAVVPVAAADLFRGSTALEEYGGPLPFVAEVWSPSTGEFDVDTKFPEYRARGDAVIWRVHPVERTVNAWERQPDGSYVARDLSGLAVIPSLHGVTIDLTALFAFA